MPYREFLPHPRLRSLVRVYWQVEHMHTCERQEHRFMPERSVRLAFTAGHSWVQGTDGALTPLYKARLDGLTLVPQQVLSVGMTRNLGAEFYPWGARQLLGWHAGMQQLDLAALYPAEASAIAALVALNCVTEARQLLEDWLLRLLSKRGEELGKGSAAAKQLYHSLGNARIGTLAEELNVSQRQLERQSVQEVGVNAKTLARVIRFEEAHNRLWLEPDQSLSLLAYDLGFSDQAHLTREFRALSQMTPRQFTQWTRLRPREAWEEEAEEVQSRLLVPSDYNLGPPRSMPE